MRAAILGNGTTTLRRTIPLKEGVFNRQITRAVDGTALAGKRLIIIKNCTIAIDR